MMEYTYQMKMLESGGYMAYCPAMKPVSVFGKTEEEATKKLGIAVALYVKRHPEIIATLRSSVLEDYDDTK